MKRRYIILLVVLEIFIMVLMGFFPNPNKSIITTQFLKTSGANDLEYTFESNELLNDSMEFKNLKHYNEISNNYTATYNFLNEEIGTSSTSIGFVDSDSSGTNTNVSILSGFKQHDYVLNISDGGSNQVDITNNFAAQTSGSIEFWLCITINNLASQEFIFRTSTTEVIRLRTYDSSGLKLQYYDGSFLNLCPLTINIWYRLRIDFECSGGGYLGLSQYTYKIYLDSIYYGTFDFMSNEASINNLRLDTGGGAIVENYLDAIGYTWDSYDLGDNLSPVIKTINSNLLTNDKYEFNIDKNDKPIAYDNVESSPSNIKDWVKQGSNVGIVNGHDISNFYAGYDYFDYDDNFVYVYSSINSYRGIYNDSMDISGINYEINFTAFTRTSTTINSRNMVILNIYGLNGSEVISWRLQDSNTTTGRMSFQYSNGIFWSTEGAFDGFDNDYTIWKFQTQANHISGNNYQFRVNFYRNETLIYTSFYHGFISNVAGISKIELFLKSPITVGFRWFFPYISIHNINIPVCGEKGYIKSNTNYYTSFNWNPGLQNLINLENINYANCFIYGHSYFGGWQRYFITNTTQTDFFDNVYQGVNPYWSYLDHSSFYAMNFQYINNSFDGFIKGVQLQENSNIYNPIYYYGNINSNESYFYVSNSRLRFTANFDQDNIAEFMLITFNLDSFLSINRSINTQTYCNGLGENYVWINYTSSIIGVYEIAAYPNNIAQILPQDRTIIGFSLDISDGNHNYLTNRTTTGYIGDITFIYIPDISTEITTYNLISAIIPFMIIFFPSISVYLPMKKKPIGGVAFIIMFAVLSLVCFASGLLPLWVLFVLIYALGFFFIISRRRTAF